MSMPLHALAYAEPTLIWGLISRGLGLVFLISFASLSRQVLATAGARGITPIATSLRAIERDFPAPQRFLYFPSLLWLGSSDTLLRALPRLGMLAGASLVVGGPHAPWAFAFCYLAYLSLDRAMILVYPWDCLLFEAGFWGMFLPATHVLPALGSVEAALPLVAWVYRLLVLRVIVGFGKHKFLGSKRQDAGFLKSFFAQQPLPTPLGLRVQRLPMRVMKLALLGMFVVELPLPLLVFVPGLPSSLAGLAMIGLMLAIWLTGNFGYFNLAMIVISLSWLDNTSAGAGVLASLLAPATPRLVCALACLHFALALLAFPFNSFCAQTWPLWSIWQRVRPRFLVWPVVFARLLQPWRLAHAYGVFPPSTPPAGRLMPVLEASWDDERWETLRFRHAPSSADSRPTWCAPHHERFDQAAVYEGLGLNESCVFRNIVGRWDPYGYGGVPAARLLLQRIVQGDVPADAFYDHTLERERGRPLVVRARSYFFEPSRAADFAATGHYFRRTLAGPHFAPRRRDEAELGEPLPYPELWHPDDVIWLERSKLGLLMRAAAAGGDVHTLVLAQAAELGPADLTRFFGEFLPSVAARFSADFCGLRAQVRELRERYGHAQLYRFERVAARYAVLLYARLAPRLLDAGIAPILGLRQAPLPVKTLHHLRLLASHIVLQGRSRIDDVMRDPHLANAELGSFTLFSGNYLHALFRYEQLVFQSQKLRALASVTEIQGRTPLTAAQQRAAAYLHGLAERSWGAIELSRWLATQFTQPEDVRDVPEAWPRFAFTQDDEVVRVDTEQAGCQPDAAEPDAAEPDALSPLKL